MASSSSVSKSTHMWTEVKRLHRIATALAHDVSYEELADLVAQECKQCLGADAICVYRLRDDAMLELIADQGCIPSFRKMWQVVPHSALKNPLRGQKLFLGTAEEFVKLVPIAKQQVDLAGRKYIGLATLEVDDRTIGIIGFSYNHSLKIPPEPEFVTILVNLCAQALERTRLSFLEKQAREKAEEANRAKTDFIANISHEIRTPLGLIQGYSELLDDSGCFSQQHRHWLQVINKNAKDLGALVGDVLDLAKIEADRLDIEPITFSPLEILQNAFSTMELKAQKKKLELRHKHFDLPSFLISDPARLRQILINLIGNAIKFTSEGFVSMESCYDDHFLIIRVRDTGIGIAPDQIPHLFQPFNQGEASTNRRFGGTGLGLVISRKLARAMGGDLTLEKSVLGEGSIFELKIRCERPTASPSVRSAKKDSIEKKLAGFSVLFIDDCEENRELVTFLLENEGCRVVTAKDGFEGKDLVRKSRFDVVLLDIQMPSMDGYETLSLLRTSGCHQPVVALTANALASEKKRSLQSGFASYLTKPIQKCSLVECIRNLASRGTSH